jgi:hypothetical protein
MRKSRLRRTDSVDNFFMTDYPFCCRFGGGGGPDYGAMAADRAAARREARVAREEDRRFMAIMKQQELDNMMKMEESRREHEMYLREMTKREELAIQRELREQTEFVAEEAEQVAEGEYTDDEGGIVLDFYDIYESELE